MTVAPPRPLDDDHRRACAERLVDLASVRLGGHVLAVSDEFFAPRDRLLVAHEPESRPGVYDAHGKWMDGWETRRRRDGGHDWCVVRLGLPGVVRAVDLDTRHFTGNFPPAASIEGCLWPAEGGESGDELPDEGAWSELLPTVELGGDRHNAHALEGGAAERTVSHLRLHLWPDGGLARLRVWGEVRPSWDRLDLSAPLDLAAVEHGGRAIACNDRHYGSPANILLPGRGVDMGDGWETRRRREPGFDWVILRLGRAGRIERLVVDTAHFRGNYPDRVAVRAARIGDLPTRAAVADAQFWPLLLGEQKLQPDSEHAFERLADLGAVDHLRVDIVPDGGLSRVRAFGRVAR